MFHRGITAHLRSHALRCFQAEIHHKNSCKRGGKNLLTFITERKRERERERWGEGVERKRERENYKVST